MKYNSAKTILVPTGYKAELITKMPYNAVKAFDELIKVYNRMGLALIIYCCNCTKPIDVYIPAEGNLIAECPHCKRQWVKSETYEIDRQNHIKGKQ